MEKVCMTEKAELELYGKKPVFIRPVRQLKETLI